MFALLQRRALIVGVSVLLLSSPALADKLTKAEIGKLGKAATAFVEVPGRGSGTAFCVHPSGLFVTNEHVVRGQEKAGINVILDASLKTQRVLSATVVRLDKDIDLALLRVTSKDELPSISLGLIEGVTELMDVVAFGFPLGAALSPGKREYPAMSVNAGNVSALRRRDGELQFIQVDVSVTFGSSGGPVLDENGKLIGVIVSGVPGQRGINLAIPVSHVQRFLSAPDIQFTPPELTRAVLDKPTEFRAKVVSVVPGAKEPNVRLILQSGEEKPREFPMAKRDGTFVATAVPVPKKSNGPVEISIRMSSGTVTGLTENIVVKVAGKNLKLSEIRRIEFKPKPRLVLASGASVEGELAGVGTIEVSLGEEKVKVDLRKALQVQVMPTSEIGVVTATVVASFDGKEVRRVEASMWVRDATAIADPSSVPITPPAMAEDRVVRRLPEPFGDVCLGGGGRYLIFHLPRARKLAVFDVNEARITNYVPLTEDIVTFAAGLEKLVIGLPKKGVLERWSLTSFEREATVFPPFKEAIQKVRLGHASLGPVAANSSFLDLNTFKDLPIHFAKDGWGADWNVFVSGDGTLFTRWGEDAVSIVMEGGKLVEYREAGMGHVIPGPDGKAVFTAKGIRSATLKRANADDDSYGYCLPAVRGSYFLSLTSDDGNGNGGSLTVYLLGHPRPLAKPDSIQHGLRFDGRDRDTFGTWKRVYFVPEANVIAILPPTNDQIVLYKFDIDAAMEKSGVDYLMVTSKPQRTVKAGATFMYTIVAKAKRRPVSFKLDAGPKGMQVSKDGVVTWKIPTDETDGNQEVILNIRDAIGQEVFHTFSLRVGK